MATMKRTEYQEQIKIFQWISKQQQLHQTNPTKTEINQEHAQHLQYAFATLNGIHTSKKQAFEAKRAGAKKGTPDLIIPNPHPNWPTLYIELKRPKGGRTSKEQRQFLQHLNNTGSHAKICHGAQAAIRAIKQYLNHGHIQDDEGIETP